MSILDEIYAHKRHDVAISKQVISTSELESAIARMPPQPSFAESIHSQEQHSSAPNALPRLIAEVKHRSPSKGILRPNFDPLDLARIYAQNGASAISVLTDEKFFGGSLEILRQITALDLGLPLLRKDFIFERYQLLEALAAGASAVLLIVAMLTPEQLNDLLSAAQELNLAAMVETHNSTEVNIALSAGASIIGVNNRNLHTFEVCLETCLQLRELIPPHVTMVAESGIRSVTDAARLAAAGVNAMLIGEALVTAVDVGVKVKEFVGESVKQP